MEEQNTQSQKEEEVTVSPSETTQTAVQSTAGSKNKAIIIVIIAVLVAGGIYYFMTNKNSQPLEFGTADEMSDLSFKAPEYPEVVVVVNGEEVSGEDYAVGVKQIAQTAVMQGADPNDPDVLAQIEAEALEVLVNTILLRQAAENSGAVVTDEDVDAKFASIEMQYGGAEEFASMIEELGLSMEDVRNDVRNELLITMYLDANPDMSAVTVSEAEVQEMYDTLTAGAEEAPTLEEIYTPIEEQLIAEKQQETVSSIIDELRAGAEIEEKI